MQWLLTILIVTACVMMLARYFYRSLKGSQAGCGSGCHQCPSQKKPGSETLVQLSNRK
jgi:hypothetical protein